MKLSCALLASMALFSPVRETEHVLRTVYVQDRALSSESTQWTSTTYGTVTGRLDGRPLPPEMLVELESSMRNERTDKRIEVSHLETRVEDGQPVAVRRQFERLTLRERRGDDEFDHKGALEGRVLLLRRDATGEVLAEVEPEAQGAELDARYLAGHQLEFTVERYLPQGEVSIGDRWELAPERALEAMGMSGGAQYFENELNRPHMQRLLKELAEVTGEVTYVADEMRDGLRCALLAVALRAEVDAADLAPSVAFPRADFGDADLIPALHLTLELEEQVWFAIDEGRPVATLAEAQGKLSIELRIDQGGHALEISIEAALAGANETNWSGK